MSRNIKYSWMSLLLSLFFVLCWCPSQAEGNAIIWSLDNGILTITGKGTMRDYGDDSSADWLADKDAIREVIVGEGITNISDGAFHDCRNIERVSLPTTLTQIGERPFWDCEKLESITIPNSVTNIGTQAFTGCSNLSSVIIENDEVDFGAIPFQNTPFRERNMQSHNGLFIIGKVLLECDSELEIFTIPSHITKIADRAFNSDKWDSKSQLKSITIPSTVKKIGAHAFWGCDHLKEVVINAPIAELPIYSFAECPELESVTLPSTIIEIGQSAFYDCKSLKNISIPESVRSISWRAFCGCDSLTSFVLPKSVEQIYGLAFAYCTNLETVALTANIDYIEDTAFDGCSKLQLSAPQGTYADEWIKQHESSFSRITWHLENGVLTITGKGTMRDYGDDSSADWLADKDAIREVIVGEGITSISDGAFHDCRNIERVSLPTTLTQIGERPFWDCEKLVAITIPKAVTRIGTQAFSGCSNLHTVIIVNEEVDFSALTFQNTPFRERNMQSNSGLFIIGNVLLECDSELETFTIPSHITKIADRAFNSDKWDSKSQLKSITIPSTVKKVGEHAFWGCDHLKEVVINAPIAELPIYSFAECPELESVTLPSTIIEIGQSAFYDCKSLKSISIPAGVTSIEWRAFCGCDSLTSIVFPDSVEHIDGLAFAYCTNLETGLLTANVDYIEDNAFDGCRKLKLSAPQGSYALNWAIEHGFAISPETRTKLILPRGTRSVSSEAFSGITTQEVYINDGCSELGDKAFSDCILLEVIHIPATVTIFGENIFEGCKNLQYITGDTESAAYFYAINHNIPFQPN